MYNLWLDKTYKLVQKCTVLVSALGFKTDSTKSQCANPQSCLQFSHTAKLGPDFTPYYHIYKCNIIFFKFILGQPHVQISIVSDRPTDSPLVWLVFSVIRFVPISRCPMTEFARVFMTIPINRVREVKKKNFRPVKFYWVKGFCLAGRVSLKASFGISTPTYTVYLLTQSTEI